MSDILKRIRILVDTSSPLSIIEQVSGQIPRFFAGNDLRFELSFVNNGVLLDADDIAQVHIEVKNFVDGQAPEPSDPALMSKFTATLDDTSTLEDFVDGSGQQCVIEFTNAQTSIAAGSKFLVVWVTSSDSPSTILTVSTGAIRVDQAGSGPGEPAPDPIEQLLTVSVANATYLRLDGTNVGGNAATLRTALGVYSEAEADALLDAKVTGPASVTDDLPAVFDGTTGKLIKQKTYAAFKTLLALVKGDVGLGNVDNTSDANKPVSTAQQAALDDKADNAQAAVKATSNAMVLRDVGRVQIPDSASVRAGTNSMTIEGWVKPSSLSASRSTIIAKGRNVATYGDGRNWNISTTSGGSISYQETSDTSTIAVTFTAPSALAVGVWTHFCFVRDYENSIGRAYVNGVLVTTETSLGFIDLDGTLAIGIGANFNVGGSALELFPADFGRMSLHSLAMTDAEVAEIFRNGLPHRNRSGAFALQTSGTLVAGQEYKIVTFEVGDSFTNVGAASNEAGVIFTATGTTPTTWSNGSEIRKRGAVINLSSETIGMEPGLWRDASGNGHNGLIHTSGAYSLKRLDTDVLTIPAVTITDSGVYLLRSGAILPDDMDVRDIAVNITDDGTSPDVTLRYDTGAATVNLATFSAVTDGRLISTPTVARPSAAHNRISAISTSGNVVADITLYLKRR